MAEAHITVTGQSYFSHEKKFLINIELFDVTLKFLVLKLEMLRQKFWVLLAYQFPYFNVLIHIQCG